MELIKKISQQFSLFSLVIILALGTEDFFLSIQNKKLISEINVKNTLPVVVSKGDKIPPLKMRSIDGDTITVSYHEGMRNYLVYVFSPECGHCKYNIPVWESITDNFKDRGVQTIGISVFPQAQTKDFREKEKVTFPLYNTVDSSIYKVFNLSRVPATVLLDKNGMVEQSWLGELHEDQVKEIGKLLGAD